MFQDIWRPVLEEITFASKNGFEALQFLDRGKGFSEKHLGDRVANVGAALQEHGLTSVMEINVVLNAAGKPRDGGRLIDTLMRNLEVIRALNCRHAHWHLTNYDLMDHDMLLALEDALVPSCEQAVALGTDYGFQFSFEHNAREVPLLVDVDHCQRLLAAVPNLGLVWDLNHTKPQQLKAFWALSPAITLLHVSDTPMPETNYHLPLGEGNINFEAFLQPLVQNGFDGAAILEIGGVPHHGGAGRDTDDALIRSQAILRKALLG